MATTNNFKAVVKLSETEYQQLKSAGTLTKSGTTITYEPLNTIYVTSSTSLLSNYPTKYEMNSAIDSAISKYITTALSTKV